jgi:hypothetical protein
MNYVNIKDPNTTAGMLLLSQLGPQSRLEKMQLLSITFQMVQVEICML